MPQEEPNEKDGSSDKTSRSLRGQLFDWATNNLFFAILPLLVAYLALPINGDPATVLERGDVFILAAALLAPEIAALRNLKASMTAGSVKSLLNFMFLLVVLSTVLFIISTSNYNAAHPDVTISSSTRAASRPNSSLPPGLPFPNMTPGVVVALSALMLIATIVIVYLGIRERQRLGGDT